jgi:hypothetical protein
MNNQVQENNNGLKELVAKMGAEEKALNEKLTKEVEAAKKLKRNFNPETDITKKVAAIELLRILVKEKKTTIISVVGFILSYGLGRLPGFMPSIGMYVFVGLGAFSLFNIQKLIKYYKEKYGV